MSVLYYRQWLVWARNKGNKEVGSHKPFEIFTQMKAVMEKRSQWRGSNTPHETFFHSNEGSLTVMERKRNTNRWWGQAYPCG